MKRSITTVAALFAAACALLAFAAPASAADEDPQARQIMERVDAVDDGDRRTSDMEMILIDKNGNRRERTMRSFSKDKGVDTQTLMFFIEPADVRNTGFLTYDYDDPDKDDDQWLYLPALKKTKRIASSDKDNAFMGSDFSYADMTDRGIENYNFTIVKENFSINGFDAWVIQSMPKTERIVDMYGYEKSWVFVDKKTHMVVGGVHWLVNSDRMKYFEVTKLEQIDGIWTSLEMTMTTKQGKTPLHSTILRNHNVRYNVESVTDDMFTVRRLEQGL